MKNINTISSNLKYLFIISTLYTLISCSSGDNIPVSMSPASQTVTAGATGSQNIVLSKKAGKDGVAVTFISSDTASLTIKDASCNIASDATTCPQPITFTTSSSSAGKSVKITISVNGTSVDDEHYSSNASANITIVDAPKN